MWEHVVFNAGSTHIGSPGKDTTHQPACQEDGGG